MAKVQISINDDLLARIDDCADNNYLSRSGLVSLACSQYLLQQEAQLLFRNMNNTLEKILERGIMDNETQREIEDITRICNLLQGK